ncbi:MAG: Lrp/AsnC family transcriptional regulator [Inquilinus sp.]|nr:Lrp/AsnC family transcriptional regulator [Inquilinus sp.]
MKAMHEIDAVDRRIINELQGGFPLSPRPYAEAAERLEMDEGELIERLQRLLDDGVLTRFGPMYHAERMGGGLTLAAMQVPEDRFEAVAEQVNAHPEVAHNYARDHVLNMWFVVATDRPDAIGETLKAIAAETGLEVFDMPKLREFFVGLRFEA